MSAPRSLVPREERPESSSGRPVWGEAGRRLSPREVGTRRAQRAAERREAADRARQAEATARTQWRQGYVRPYRITAAIDARGLSGRSVDEACGVEEPAVNLWESGDLYPTWEQLGALAALCEMPTSYFLTPDPPAVLPAGGASLDFHVPRLDSGPPPVPGYPPEVVAATVAERGQVAALRGVRCQCEGVCGRGSHVGRCPNTEGAPSYGSGITARLAAVVVRGLQQVYCQGCHLYFEQRAEGERAGRAPQPVEPSAMHGLFEMPQQD